MNLILLIPIILPITIGFICLIVPWQRIREVFTFIGMLLTTAVALKILLLNELRLQIEWITLSSAQINFDLISYHFSAFILLACSFFGLLITIYSLKQMKGKYRLKEYYIYLLWTVGIANGSILSNNLVILLIFWSIMPVLLYLLIDISGSGSGKAALKSIIIVGGSDFLMLLGVVIIWHLKGTITMNEIIIPIEDGLSTAAFILLTIGAVAKAGAMPFHSWIPDAAEVAHVPVMAFLPAALDKLLGIYLLVRIALDLFIMDYSMKVLLMSIGAVTIIAAVMMALVQKDLKKLLSYHAVSQVGYMVLGIGTGTLIGIAGGLFHMLNNVIFKCCLFLCCGAVEHRIKTTNLERLGGLARTMPVTFITCTIAALSISGIPPFNGFVSKWMVYQGTIDVGGSIWPIFLIAAMFGSALTLASFVKVLHSVFLGEKPKEIMEPKEVEFSMKVPLVILALFCVFFGIFAQFPLKYFIGPVLEVRFSGIGEAINLNGMWSPTLATTLLAFSLVCGIIFYRLGNIKALKEGDIFVGGEPIDCEEVRISGIHFYDTIESTGFLKYLYKKAKARAFDPYEWGKTISFSLYSGLSKIHMGILPIYILWIIVGFAVLLFILMK